MGRLPWLRRLGPCHIETHILDRWQVIQVCGRFSGDRGKKGLLAEVDRLLGAGRRQLVVDLSEARLNDDSVAAAAPEAYRRACAAGADMRFVVLPGRAGGFYHMAGLEMTLPTFTRLRDAVAA
ncbi:MAG: STAS domain-containing protein [Acidobacteriota bacterium]